ncbi:hypothetical protein [Cupriavidus pauculus]|uniref:hypothetical protein n=1 Tax=Cupriavidus pauculus TaxID=82633 RepID=UPI0012480616|nr:hypothetical protein [Cupriavidus pauculus]KAB0604740.1 hypothetical protein F7R19_04040 [Cupriavidus pauculus]UAK98826.1 hypothetical protein K8O84_12485 [Cupriavidus pauculus]
MVESVFVLVVGVPPPAGVVVVVVVVVVVTLLLLTVVVVFVVVCDVEPSGFVVVFVCVFAVSVCAHFKHTSTPFTVPVHMPAVLSHF